MSHNYPGSSPTRVLVPAGALGSGVRADELEIGLSLSPHAIALDAGSTDSGPAYLATARSKYSRSAVKRDLALLMGARERAGIPLLIGSCGTSGCDAALDWTKDIVLEIAAEQNYVGRLALIYSEQSKDAVKQFTIEGRIQALSPAAPLRVEEIDACEHIVAVLGAEPYIGALEHGADIVLGGRTTDTALIAAVPLMRGAHRGAAWHAAKIAECGGLCTTHPARPAVIVSVDHDGFEVAPISPVSRCTPQTVSAHMLYENADPFRLIEPGGVLDVSAAHYASIDDRTVRVEGARFDVSPYTMKLEGAGGGPFQTMMLIGIEDPNVLTDIDTFLSKMLHTLQRRVARTLTDASDIGLSLRPYGWNAVSGVGLPPGTAPPREIGLLFIATAATQERATEAAKICNPAFFHFSARAEQELPSYAFPFSPAEIERGQVFEFHLNHAVAVRSPSELSRTIFTDLQASDDARG